RSLGDFDALDRFDRNELGPDERGQVGAIVHHVPVDHDLHDAGATAKPAGHAAHTDRWIDEIVDDVEPGSLRQDLGERPPAVGGDVLTRDRVDVGGGDRTLLFGTT